jgi:hypothetical protein
LPAFDPSKIRKLDFEDDLVRLLDEWEAERDNETE